ncbi:MAG TPA: cytochrome P450 [Solirubrobacterales bacterium]|nr:cytochrome P450 [Solirubrobacterales bacterium]
MEAATAARPQASSGASSSARPPAVGLPRTLQTARFLVRPVAFFEHYRRELGPTFAARLLGPGDVVFISDADSVKRLFGADRVNTIAPGRNIVLRPLLGGQSLLLQEGEDHLRRRKLMLPPFHGERMRAYEEAIAAVTEAEIATWPRERSFSIHPHMQAITLEVILRAVFGVSDPARRDALTGSLVAILAESASPAAIGLVFPGVRRLPRFRAFARMLERTDALLAEEIAERRADPDLESRDDILSMLVAARFEDGSRMSDTELRDQLMTLLLAGHETTATGLAWTFDLLLHRRDALERLVGELDSGESEYLDAVIEESLRVRPVVPMTGRLLKEPASLGGYDLDRGTVILVAIYMTHTDPDLYPDPHAFRPERFLDADPGTYSWIPFGGGTRRCIGAAFAQMEMRVVLRTILERFELRAASPEPERPIRRNVTLSPRGGTRVIATPR